MRAEPERASLEQLRRASAAVESRLAAFVNSQRLGEFYDLIRYRLGWQTPDGPPAIRPRAVLCLLACQACGGRQAMALPMATAIALLHIFAANQEELERGLETRHGRPSVASVWGVPQAMNAGDSLHALAKMALLGTRRRLPGPKILRLEELLDESSLHACEAIHDELEGRAGDVELAAAKSAVLFGCAAYAGGYLAAVDEAISRQLRCFGDLLGSAVGVMPLDRVRAESYYRQSLGALEEARLPAASAAPMRTLAEWVMGLC
jgi:geranylgeranyl diphosphate synthase type I